MKRASRVLCCAIFALTSFAFVPAHAGIFGESDEEKAAREQHEDSQDAANRQIDQRVHDLEATLSRLTGDNEMLSHRVDQLNAKIDKQKKDFDYRLCTLAAQQLGAATAEQGQAAALPCDSSNGAMPEGAAPAPSSAQPSGSLPSAPTASAMPSPGPGRAPGTLGTLPQSAGLPLAPASPDEMAIRKQFTEAKAFLAKTEYDQARAAFRGFADTYPKHELASQAVYWVGDISYLQKDYLGASRAFAEELQKYPKAPLAADSMLKLGQSLIYSGQKEDGCVALAALPRKYPDAATNIKSQAKALRKSACR